MVKKKSIENTGNGKLVSFLAYFLIGVVWYFLSKKDQNLQTKFHVTQALNLFVFYIVIEFIFKLLGFGFLSFVVWPAWIISQILLFVFWVIGIIYAIQDNRQEIPIIGKFAQKYLKF